MAFSLGTSHTSVAHAAYPEERGLIRSSRSLSLSLASFPEMPTLASSSFSSLTVSMPSPSDSQLSSMPTKRSSTLSTSVLVPSSSTPPNISPEVPTSSSLTPVLSSAAASSDIIDDEVPSIDGSTTDVETIIIIDDTLTVTNTHLASASSMPSSQAVGAASNSGSPSFFENRAAIAGVFTAVGLVLLIPLLLILRCLSRRRRQQRLDREMDEVSAVPASVRAFLEDDDEASVDFSSPGSHSYENEFSATSHGSCAQPSLSTAPCFHPGWGIPSTGNQQYNSDAYPTAPPPIYQRFSLGPNGEPQIVSQSHRAKVYQTPPTSERARRPSHSAVIVYNDSPDAAPRPGDYLSRYNIE
ncbi:hypothetical protein R3P38DRAFT_3608434 [Favolaschia claudopus]|uniref:Uncharacterized protein n=1 Tax=Favolaschia claudopus TaxID=2862362 RepID=A0AAW0DJ56_9AGAR